MHEAFQAVTLKAMVRHEKASEDIALTFDPTPEGIVTFCQKIVEYVGANRLDNERASIIRSCLETICRVSESGIDAVKHIEESTTNLAQAVRTITREHPKPTG